MSWLTEEWKERIPQDALSHISSMELTLEKQTKEISQYRFKSESLELELEKCKQIQDEKSSEIQHFERENSQLQTKLDSEQKSLKQLVQNLSLKENHLVDLQEELNRLKSENSKQKDLIAKLENENEKLKEKDNIMCKQNNENRGKYTEACYLSEQRLEEIKRQLEESLREKVETEKIYEKKVQLLLCEINDEKETNANLQKQISSLQYTVHIYESKTKGNCAENERTEIMSMKEIIFAKEKEIEELKEKLNVKNEIGGYLGIDVRKICSESTIRNDDYTKILLKNKTLQEELNAIKSQHEKQAVLEMNGNIDSGFLTKSSSLEQGESATTPTTNTIITPQIYKAGNEEVIISRMETDSEIGNSNNNPESFKGFRISMENNYVNQNHNNAFIDSENNSNILPNNCNISHKICNMLATCKEENKKLKEEISQMREIYENHMKVCKNRSVRKSVSISSQQECPQADEMRRKIIFLEHNIDELQKDISYREEQYGRLQEEITNLRNSGISETALCKLEDLVDVILQQKNSGPQCNTGNTAVLDTELLKSVVCNSLHSFQNGIIADQEIVCQCIQNSTKVILSAIEGISFAQNRTNSSPSAKRDYNSRNKSSATNNYNRKSPNTVQYRNSPYVRSKAGIESIDELEGIKERLNNLQQIIFGRESEVRKIENERDKFSEELVKLVELTKKKEEENGRISRLFNNEKQKVDDNDACYRAEMEALKKEQLEIYKEFRDMCDNLKKKDIELLNKTKQTKILCAEWRQKEDDLNEKILSLEKVKSQLENQLGSVNRDLEEKSKECDVLLHRLNHVEEQLQTVYENLAKVETLLLKAKADGLYK